MLQISFYEPNGKIRFYTTVPDLETADYASGKEGLPYVVGTPLGEGAYVLDGVIFALPPQPTAAHVFDYSTKEWVDPRTLDDLKSAQIALVDRGFEAASAALVEGYPPAERLTWPTQQAEALAWQANSTAPTPFLDGIAASRGITPEDMRQKTLENVLLFMGASQQLVGQRQKLKDQITAATTVEEVQAIVWALPG